MAMSDAEVRPQHHQRETRHRPPGVSDETVAALGKLSEGLEMVEQARGMLYGFHRLCGSADLTLQEAADQLREAGHPRLADQVEQVLVGRNIVDDKWSFEIVEAYDTQYWQVVREVEHDVRLQAGVPEPHLFEAELKRKERGGDADTTSCAWIG